MEDSQVSATGSTATAGDKLQNNMLASAIGRISELEKGVVALDRENRDKNIRFINAPEEGQDNCIIKVANMIKNNNLVQHAHNLPLNDIVRAIENAHRIGKVIVGHNRHILVKFHSNVYRDEVMRMFKACGKKPVEWFEFKDYLAREDKKVHVKYAPYMKRMFDNNGTSLF